MEFEEMKKIWDTQSNQNYYAIDEETINKRIMKKNLGLKRKSSFDEWALIAISLFVAAFMTYKGIVHDQAYKFASSAIFLFVAGYLYWDRKKRIKNDGVSDNTLLGNLEQAIRTINYSIRKQRNFIWWFLLPAAISVIINHIYTYNGEVVVIVGLTGTFLLALFVVQIGLKYHSLPKKRELESLRNLLIDSEN